MATTLAAPAASIFSDRIQRIEVSATMAITAEALRLKRSGVDLADFGAGEPHFNTPDHIKQAGIDAIVQNHTRYTAVAGIPEIRQAIVDRHSADFGTDYTPDECVFTSGGKLALFNAMEVLINHGDEVIVPVPYWVSYKDIIQFAGGVPVFVETEEAENFRLTAAMVQAAITPRTRCIILNSPSNPSGAIIAPDDLRDIVRLAHERQIFVLLDECYVYLNFTGDTVSGASATDCKPHILVLGSLSKTYAMTGWRAGFALGPKPVIAAMSKLQSQSTSNTSTVVQYASIAAVSGPQQCVTDMRSGYVEIRDRILSGMSNIPGLTCTTPPGRLLRLSQCQRFLRPRRHPYRVRRCRPPSIRSPRRLRPRRALRHADHIRLSYAVSAPVIDKGLERMRDFFQSLQ